MNLIKYGIASVVLAGAVVVACGGSSSSGNGSGAGTSNSSAGTSSSTGGSSASTGGSSSSTGGSSTSHAGTTSTSTGGNCGTTMDPMAQMCPAALTCIETKCKSDIDACTSSTGVCGAYIKCATACNCDQTCLGTCPQSSACQSCFGTYLGCAESNCLSDLFSCAGNGTGGTSSGSGGTFSFDAGAAHTCAELTTCCATLTDASQKQSCTQVANLKIEFACSLSYSSFCPG